MTPFIPYIIAAGVAALIIGGFVLGRLVERRGMQATNQAYERLIDKCEQQFADLLDRFYVKQKMAPQGADLLARDEESRTQEKERRSGPRRVATNQVGHVERARTQLALAEQRDLKLGT